VQKGDEIVVSAMEHHSNIVPWQLLCDKTGAQLKVIPMNSAGELDMNAYSHMLGKKTRLVAVTRLLELEGLSIIGTAKHKAAVISFLFGDVHPHDIGTILDQEGIAVRTGHHCAQPVMDFFSIPATARASFALYNSPRDIDRLAAGIKKIGEVFA